MRDVETPEFRLLFEQVPGMFLVLLPDPPRFTIVAVSDDYARATHTRREDIVGSGLFDVFPDNPDDPTATGVANLRSSLLRVIERGIPDPMAVQKYDIRLRSPEGGGFEERWWTPVNTPIRDGTGRLRYLLHHVEDVTEIVRLQEASAGHEQRSETLRKRVEATELDLSRRGAELEATRRRMLEVLRHTDLAVFGLAPDGRVTVAEGRLLGALGLGPSPIVGRDYRDVFGQTPVVVDTMRRALGGETVTATVELAGRHCSARTAPTEATDGTLDGISAVFVDVTEVENARRSLEIERQKLEAIFVHSPASMALLRGPSLIFEKANPDYLALVGGRDILGRPFDEALPELADQPTKRRLQEVFATGVPFAAKEVVAELVRRPGGPPEPAYFDTTYSRILDAFGEPYGVYLHAVDVTEKVIARRRVEELARDLQDTVRARDDFLAVASHELKTPLTTLTLQTHLFRRTAQAKDRSIYEPARVDAMVQRTEDQVLRLAKLVDDMLHVSRVRSGRLSLTREPFDLRALVLECVDRMASRFGATGHPCPDLTDRAEVTGTWDRHRLEQVITNLLANAVRYGKGSPVRVRLDDRGSDVVLVVEDQGIGIAPEAHARIFERFERAIDANEVSGLGLGLFISRQIVQAHGGRIWVESEPGKGASFFVQLPKDPPEIPRATTDVA